LNLADIGRFRQLGAGNIFPLVFVVSDFPMEHNPFPVRDTPKANMTGTVQKSRLLLDN
jgi:hypothetical protein